MKWQHPLDFDFFWKLEGQTKSGRTLGYYVFIKDSKYKVDLYAPLF